MASPSELFISRAVAPTSATSASIPAIIASQPTVALRTFARVISFGMSIFSRSFHFAFAALYSNCALVTAGIATADSSEIVSMVLAVGDNEFGQCGVSDWTDIKLPASKSSAAEAEPDYTEQAAAAHRDTTISAGFRNTIGLKADGTAVAVGNNAYNVSGWSDLTAISSGWFHMVGLRSDGTVIAAGNSDRGQCDVSDWKLW